MSLVILLCDDDAIEPVAALVETQGYSRSAACTMQQLRDALTEKPDVAALLSATDALHVLHEMDEHGMRYWLLCIGAAPAAWAPLLPRKPHAMVPTAHAAGGRFIEQLLDDWRDRMVPRVDCFHFSFRDGVPACADWVLDVRFLESPHWVPALRAEPADSPEVAAYITGQPAAQMLLRDFTAMLIDLLPGFIRQRRTVIRIGVGCTGGEHRSVAMADALVASINATERATARHLDEPPAFLPHDVPYVTRSWRVPATPE